ncbi:uncharacterized protein LOC142640124 [Castanea sativa]|uniref:uncharacterized protein LOC142640124 n=1 Tax=Castanea sativa TaxID=21020 RepID=UPI003F64D6EA
MDEDVESDGENEEDANRNRVGFFSNEDLDAVLMKGLWFIGDHFLSIRPWEPFFKSSMANVSVITVWIRLCELPIELYDAEVLKQIGESIGKVLRIDSHTAMEARGKYARLCIQVDVNKPLVNTICIGHFEWVVSDLQRYSQSLFFLWKAWA